MNFNETLKIKQQAAEKILDDYLPKAEGYAGVIMEAMHYSVLAGGKRLRPVMMKESYKLFGGSSKIIEPFMAAIEMIHTYSLVHDDLPAMDNDDYRRGKLTTWKKYGEDMGVLAGDALLNYAVETALRAFDMCKTLDEYKRVSKAMSVLFSKAGIYGMIGGQTVDVISENDNNVTLDKLNYIHKNKTAALIEASLMCGAILAGASDKSVFDIEKAAENIGLAFQIQDDVLDVTSTTEELGKPVGSDEKNNKATFVSLFGLSEAKDKVKELSDEAIEILQDIADENRADGSFLMTLTQALIAREK